MKSATHPLETMRIVTIKDSNTTKRIVMKSVSDTKLFAAQCVKNLRGGDVLALSGNLGSGKTTFTQMVARELGVKESVTSPTFVLMKLYAVPKHRNGIFQVCHIDAYRLESSAELKTIGGHEYIADQNTLTVIEWPEKVRNMVPKSAVWISFALDDKVE